jgi:hypothetical protein
MAWSRNLRAKSFVIVTGVVLMESAMVLLPIGIALCVFARMDAARVFRDLAIVGFAFSIAIAVHGDLGRQGYRKWWRARA